jgi:hypothetical protein
VQDIGRIGQCLYAKERFGGDVKVRWLDRACKGFEDKLTGQRPGKKYQGVRRGR